MANDSNRRHVFISHHHRDDAEVTKLTNLLSKHGKDVRNSSVRLRPENRSRWEGGRVKEATVQRLLRRKVSWASTVVVLVGKETHTRKWVDWEIRQAHRQGKRIVGVYVRGGTEADLPPSLKKYAADIRPWNAAGILEAIDGSDTPFQGPGGVASSPIYAATTSNC